jgi:hypothetical protein
MNALSETLVVDQLGFLVGGYDGDSGEVFEVGLPSGVVNQLATTSKAGAAWRGQTEVVQRIHKGLALDALFHEAVVAGKTEEVGELRPLFAKLEYKIPFEAMNLQDAIDFASFLIRATIDAQRFTLHVGHRRLPQMLLM